ncbi:unnamed protein product [Arabis nemorensis]|uniref:Uncharacterized protein n=1 Tax=Arabis nemorensis TaxID=586526 RepID=A0A565BL13_9BRAS|nr:unnamed protein product [Arabis nemorensis]
MIHFFSLAVAKVGRFHYQSGDSSGGGGAHYPVPNPGLFSPQTNGGMAVKGNVPVAGGKRGNGQADRNGRDVHMFG